MKISSKIFLLSSALVLAGAGCFGRGDADVRDAGVFRSADQGLSWEQRVAYPTLQGVGAISTVDSIRLEGDPSDEKTFYLGTIGNGLLLSTDAMASWASPRESALQSGTILDIAVDPKDVCTVYVTNGPKLFKSEDCLRSAQSIYHETRPEIIPTRVEVDWFNPSTVYLGLSNGDLLKSTDRGRNWTKIYAAASPITEILMSYKDSRVLILGTERKGLFRSTDAGSTWVELARSLESYQDSESVYRIVQIDSGGAIYVASRYGIMRSDNIGETWYPLSLVTAPGEVVIRALAVHSKDAQTLYYATDSTLYQSQDGGVTWSAARLPTTRAASSLLLDREDENILYLGVRKIEK